MGCKQEFPLTIAFFHAEKSRRAGLSYRCRPCESVRAKGRPKRPERWLHMTPKQKAAKSKAQKKIYDKTPISVHRVRSYKAIDKRKGHAFDLDLQWYDDNIHQRPCHYCGDEGMVGCDRIDNSRGHSKDNVVPCCLDCNTARSHRFSYDEMVMLGETVRRIKDRRNQVLLQTKVRT